MQRKTLLNILASVLILTSLIGCTSTQVDEFASPRQEDLHTLVTKLPSLHKDFYHAGNKAAFAGQYEAVLPTIDSISDADFYFTLRSLAAFAADSHTMIGMNEGLAAQLHALPLKLTYMENAWHLQVVLDNKRELLGAQVIAMNGIPIETIVTKASALVGYDNEVWLYRSLSKLLHISELLAFIGIAEDALAPVTLTVIPLGSSESESYAAQPIGAAEFGRFAFATLFERIPKTGISSEPYRYLSLVQENALFIQYNVCASDAGYPFESFMEEVLALLDEERPRQVVVDLRYNGGGDSRLFEPMVRELGKRQKETGFTLYVLIGEGTFSSALMNAMHFKLRTHCTIVGTPSGGSVNHYGEVATFTLPNSTLPVMYSTKRFVMDKHHPGGPLVPDLIIQQRVTDQMAGIDTVLETLLLH